MQQQKTSTIIMNSDHILRFKWEDDRIKNKNDKKELYNLNNQIIPNLKIQKRNFISPKSVLKAIK